MKTICRSVKKHIAECAKEKYLHFDEIKRKFYQSYDMRIKKNREELGKLSQSYKDMGGAEGMREIFNKRISRNIQRSEKFTNIYDNHLIVDYLANKRYLTNIYENGLCFCGRNHYARNEQDLKIISILKKYAK